VVLAACGGAAPDDDMAVDTEVPDGTQTEEHRDEAEPTRVTLSTDAWRTAGIVTATLSATPASATGENLEVPGEVAVDPRRIAVVSARTAGRIERLLAIAGERVETGQAVAELFTPEFAVAQADLQQAVQRAALLAGTRDSAGAAALAAASRRRLRLLGASAAEVGKLEAGGEPSGTLAITAPLSGSVLESHVLAGTAVESGEPIFTVADLSVVDVVAEVPERSLALVRAGQHATVTIAALPGVRFEGTVERLKDALNPETRTVQAVIHVPNTGRRLRPGMFASVSLAVSTRESLGARGSVLTIASSAVVSSGEQRFVFIEVGERSYERRDVRLAPLVPSGSTGGQADRVVVLDGVRAGEKVVTRGAFTLKSELAKSSLSDDH
jgi:RND family efflux transporter MFP subunit